jgi:tetratricopeptide (TPR) repeat protein
MTARTLSRTRCLLLLLFSVPLACGLLVVGLPWLRGSEKLAGLQPLLDAHRFDEAERRIGSFLRDHPDSPQANMLMAQVALARTDQKPELALRHLARVRPRDRATSTIVRLNEGKAFSAQGRYLQAERSWLEALRIDPLVPEAGWALLGLYYIQGRREDAHRLAMRLHASEPNPRDRVQFLLELLRQDAKSVVTETLVVTLEPIVREHPEDLHTALALGKALVRTSRPDEGIEMLRAAGSRFPENPDAWDALLTGLEESFRFDELDQALGRLPASLSAQSRFAKFRGIVAQSRKDWPAAVAAYLRARDHDPANVQVLYRLCQALRAIGRDGEIEPFERRRRSLELAREQALRVYEEADAVKSLEAKGHERRYQRIADLREAMGRSDEALAWHRLVLEHEPEDATSRAAVGRLVRVAGDQEALPEVGLKGPGR